jgi:hypothetical protein
MVEVIDLPMNGVTEGLDPLASFVESRPSRRTRTRK